MHCRHSPNDTVQMLETTAKRHKLLSPTAAADEPPSRPPSPALLDELIIEILLRLPVRSLLQFRCVCKSWKTLISDPQFAKNHLRISMSDPSMTHQHVASTITDEECKIVSFSVQSLFQNPPDHPKARYFRMNYKYEILGCCNGLLCLFDVFHRYFRLWNPSARLRSKRSPVVVSRNWFYHVYNHGFGYDQVNDKYKVVVVDGLVGETVTKVYTFGDNSWRTVQNFPHAPNRSSGKFVSGTLNWVARKGDSSDQWVILSFDMEKETYGEVLLPLEQDGGKIKNPVLDILNNCLCVWDFDGTHGVAWMMKKYGVRESWTKLMMIPRVKSRMYSFNPLCISENGIVLAHVGSNLALYDPSNRRWLDYSSTEGKVGCELHIYHETLVSPKC